MTSHPDDTIEATIWGRYDPRHVFLRVLNVAWAVVGVLAAVFLEALQIPAGTLPVTVVTLTVSTSLVVFVLVSLGRPHLAAYVFCISVDLAFFVLYFLAHGVLPNEPGKFAEARGVILAMSGLGIVFAGAMLNRWVPVAFAAVNVFILFFVIRGILPEVGMRISLPILWWVLALSVWMFNTYLQRLIVHLSTLNAGRRAQMKRLSEDAALLDLASDAIFIQDAHSVIQFWNQGAARIYGLHAPAVLGKRLDDLIVTEYPRPQREIAEHLFRYGRWEGELRQRSADGRDIWISSHWSLRRDTVDGPAAILVINSEITDRISQEARLTYLSEHDLLTGLPNRALLVDRLGQAMLRTRRNGQALALIVIDVDRFKSINSGLGHSVGDSVLQNVANRVQAAVGEENTVAHLAGDTFGIILENCGTKANISTTAEHILGQVAEPMEIQSHRLVITLSIGIAVYASGNEGVNDLIRDADIAMYAAKDAGRNGYRLFEPSFNQRHLKRTSLENALRRAIERNELYLAYQPKVDTQSDRIRGVEVLLRWNSVEFGPLTPGDFIPLAEETGLINTIGLWVLKSACKQVRAWHDLGYSNLTLAVNLSARQFQEKNIVDSVVAALTATGFPADHLELEITESTIVQHVDQAISLMQKLNRLGIRLAIDDFGTGYSSLNYLKRFPVHSLKIDQSFVRDLVHSPSDASIVAAVNSLAKSLGLHVVAEGVETTDQLDYLRTLQCDEYQGFLFSRPVVAAEMEALLVTDALRNTSQKKSIAS